MKHRLWFAAGLLVGILAAVYAVLNMYDTLYVGLDMSRKDSSAYIMKKSLTRAAIALALMVVSVLLDPYAFTGVVVGLLSIKTSGLFNRLLGRFLKKE
jgi:c-di-GMP-related signal transduction protein